MMKKGWTSVEFPVVSLDPGPFYPCGNRVFGATYCVSWVTVDGTVWHLGLITIFTGITGMVPPTFAL